MCSLIFSGSKVIKETIGRGFTKVSTALCFYVNCDEYTKQLVKFNSEVGGLSIYLFQ